MKTQLKKVCVKAQYNGGGNASYDTTIVEFTEISVCRCGCGGIPKIEQDSDGRPMYDYSGELIKIKCAKCGIFAPTQKARTYYDSKKLNQELIQCVKDGIKIWNQAFFRNEKTEIKFSTNP